MNKSVKYYALAILIIILSFIFAVYTQTIHKSYNTDNLYEWYIFEEYDNLFEEMQVIYLYSNQGNITGAAFEDLPGNGSLFDSEEFLNFYDESGNTQLTMIINNITVRDNKVFYYDMTWAEAVQYDDYKLIGKLTFQYGYYTINLDHHVTTSNQPFITTDQIITETIADYSEYTFIPLITGVIGVMLLLLTFVSKPRGYDSDNSNQNNHKRNRKKSSYDHDPYKQGRHKSKSKKREKY